MSDARARPQPKVRLWSEVPASERVQEADVRERRGSSNPEWLARQLRLLSHPAGCRAATRWGLGLWFPCRFGVVDGESLCWRHGGARRPARVPAACDPLAQAQRLERLRADRDRLLARLEPMKRRLSKLDLAIELAVSGQQ